MLNHISTIWEYLDFLTIHKSHLDVSQLLLKSKYMCLDSASENNSIYQFFQEKNIIPLIDHNKWRKSVESKTGESINSDDIPVCSCNHTMTYGGYDHTRYRKKYRCPLKTGLIDSCLLHKHALLPTMEELLMLRTKIMSLDLKGLFPMVHLNGNLFTKIVPALKESTMQY